MESKGSQHRARRALIALCMLAAAAPLRAQAATTPPSAFGSAEVAFHRAGELWRIRTNGSLLQVTSNSADDAQPAWSPDGYRFAYSTDDVHPSHPRIAVIDTRGTLAPADVSGGTETEYFEAPAWTPDGSTIVYAGFTAGNWDVYARDWRATDPATKLTSDPGRDYDPAVSPDGTRIAFTSDRTGYADVFTMDAAGGNQTNVTTSDRVTEAHPTWSPDGTQLAYEADGAIYARVLATNETRLIAGARGFVAMQPSWSPDGASIAFAGAVVPGDFDVYVAAADGSTPLPSQSARLTDDPDNDTQPAWEPAHAPDVSGPTFTVESPNPPPAATEWRTEPLTVTFVCTDTGSQVVVPKPTATLASDGADQSARAPCADYAGNVTLAHLDHINIDATAPSATIDTMTGGVRSFIARGKSSDATAGVGKVFLEFYPYTVPNLESPAGGRLSIVALDSKCKVPCAAWEVKNQIVPPGIWQVAVHAVDRAGNDYYSAIKTVTIQKL